MKKEPLLKETFVQNRIIEFLFRKGWGRNLQGALDRLLAFDLREINLVLMVLLENPGHIQLGRGDLDLPFQEADRFAQVADWDDLQASNDCGLSGVLRRNQDSHLALLARAQGNGQRPFDHPHRPASATSHAVGLLDN